MSHTIRTSEFEGPLGLLLELVERNKVEVTAISVAEITAQYLARIKELKDQSAEHISEFLQLGARLLYIKSLALLPQDASTEQNQELERLNLELEEYRRFQHLARELGRRSTQPSWERQAYERLQAHELPLPNLTLQQLAAAFGQALRRTQPIPTSAHQVLAHLSLDTALTRLRQRLPAGFNLDETFADCKDRVEVTVMFLALLELMRTGAAQATQATQFAPIRVEASTRHKEAAHV